MGLHSLVSSLEYLVSNGRQVLLGGIRLGGCTTDPTPHGYSLPNEHSPPHGFSLEPKNPVPSNPLLPNREVDVEDVVLVPNAQSVPNEIGVCPDVRAKYQSNDGVVAPQEIPLT